jgi:hypothetical protein
MEVAIWQKIKARNVRVRSTRVCTVSIDVVGGEDTDSFRKNKNSFLKAIYRPPCSCSHLVGDGVVELEKGEVLPAEDPHHPDRL